MPRLVLPAGDAVRECSLLPELGLVGAESFGAADFLPAAELYFQLVTLAASTTVAGFFSSSNGATASGGATVAFAVPAGAVAASVAGFAEAVVAGTTGFGAGG